MPPAVVEDLPQLQPRLLWKRDLQVSHRAAIATGEKFSGDVAQPGAPAHGLLGGCVTHAARNDAVERVLETLTPLRFGSSHERSAATRSITAGSNTNSAGIGMMSRRSSFTPSFSVVTITSAPDAAAASSMRCRSCGR